MLRIMVFQHFLSNLYDEYYFPFIHDSFFSFFFLIYNELRVMVVGREGL